MTELAFRCPRCKETFASPDAEQLADAVLAHLEEEHGHAPPREHVLARIQRHKSGTGDVSGA